MSPPAASEPPTASNAAFRRQEGRSDPSVANLSDNLSESPSSCTTSVLRMSELRSRNRFTNDSPTNVKRSELPVQSKHDSSIVTKSYSLYKTMQHAHQFWAQLSNHSRIFLTVLSAWFLAVALLASIDLVFQTTGRVELDANSGFVVAINTYKRPQMLKEAVQHYAQTCGRKFRVEKVVVLWAEQDTEPPSSDSFFNLLRSSALQQSNRAPLELVKLPRDSLNARFLPLTNPPSSGAVFMVDDDVRVDCPSLLNAFQAWTAFPDSMVGFYPRLALPPRHAPLGALPTIYHTWPTVFLRQQFNMILTKAAFLHTRYLELYSDPQRHPPELLEYVDQHMNCEDVAMSLLVANVTTAPPIYVEASVSDKGLFGGISTGSGHMTQRSQCLKDMTQVYQRHYQTSPLQHTVDLSTHSWIHHAPGFGWQARPSNFFEWFGLANFFQ